MKLSHQMQHSKLKNCKVTGCLHAKTLAAEKKFHKLELALRSRYFKPLGPKLEGKTAFFLSLYKVRFQLKASKTISIPQKQI